MMPASLRSRKVITVVQPILLAVIELLGAAELAKVVLHRHDVLRALTGDGWDDDGWYFLSMGGEAIGVLGVVFAFALAYWRQGVSYLAPITLLISVVAVDFTFGDFGLAAGKLIFHSDNVWSILTQYWYPPAIGILITALCLYAAVRVSKPSVSSIAV